MLTHPDFIQKKLVYIGTGDPSIANDLKFSNGNIQLYRDGKRVDQISCHLVFSICIIGQTTISSKLIEKLQAYGISLCLLNSNLKPYAVVNSVAEGNYALRQKQYVKAEKAAHVIAQQLIVNKIKNQQRVLHSYGHAVDLSEQLKKAVSASGKRLLGIEGTAAKKYFQALYKEHKWYRRSPRTKEDISNLLLDIGYTFLFNYVDALLSLFGFDTYKGYYHQLYFQRKSLTCDVMEPLRPLIDRQLVKSYNLNQISEKDFVYKNGSYHFVDYKVSTKYTMLFLNCLIKSREKIFQYVRSFYLHISDPVKYPYQEIGVV